MVERSFGGSLLLLAFAFVEVGAVLNVVNFRDSAKSEKRDLVRRSCQLSFFWTRPLQNTSSLGSQKSSRLTIHRLLTLIR